MTLVKNPAAPGSSEHTRIVTASKVPAILGLDPWKTPAELWLEMTGTVTPDPVEGDHLDFGHDSEESLCRFWVRKNPEWALSAGTVRSGSRERGYTNPDLPFENQATIDARAIRRRGKREHRILECKTSASTMWGDVGDELPAHVAAQVQAQMGISGIHQATVIALVSGDKPMVPRLYDLTFDENLWAEMVGIITAFWDSLGQAEPPLPDDDVIDQLAHLHPTISDDEVEAGEEIADQLREAQQAFEVAKDDLEQARHKAALILGDHKRLVHDGQVLATQTPGRFSQKNLPENYRHLTQMGDYMSPRFDPKKLKAAHPDIYQAGVGPNTIRYK